MEFIKQLMIIIFISFLGEAMRFILPFPIPASVYGMVLMLAALLAGIIKLEHVEKTSYFLIEIMPMMLIPPAVGLIDSWSELAPILFPISVITFVTTIIVMFFSGHATQAVIKFTANGGVFKERGKGKGHKDGSD